MNTEEPKRKDFLVKNIGYCSVFKKVVGIDPGGSGDLHMYYGALMCNADGKPVLKVDECFYHQRVSNLFGDLVDLTLFLRGYSNCITDIVGKWQYNTERLFPDEIER